MSLLAMSLRSVLRGKRLFVVALLPLLVLIIAVVVTRTADGADRAANYGGLATGLLVLVISLVSLVLGVNAFGEDRDERTLGLLLATTLPRWRIVVAKWTAATLVTWTACLPAALGCLYLASATSLPGGTAAWSLLLGSLLAAAAYVALFVLLALVLRRAVLVGLVYLVLWEGLLAGTTTAFRNLSVSSYASRVTAAPLPEVPELVADTGVAGACLVLLLVAVAFVGITAWRLPRAHL